MVFNVETFIRNIFEICSVVLNMKHAAALSGRLDRQTWLVILLFLLSITCKESNEESGKNYAKNLPHIPSMAFSLLTKRNQVPGHLITRLDIYRLLKNIHTIQFRISFHCAKFRVSFIFVIIARLNNTSEKTVTSLSTISPTQRLARSNSI